MTKVCPGKPRRPVLVAGRLIDQPVLKRLTAECSEAESSCRWRAACRVVDRLCAFLRHLRVCSMFFAMSLEAAPVRGSTTRCH